MSKYDLLLKDGTIVTHEKEFVADIAIKDGEFTEIGNLVNEADASEVIDCKGLHILPGVIDSQVHFREPGNEHKEDLEAGTRGAVLGGVVGIFDMPNTNPPTTSKDALEDKINRCKDRAWCDFAFYVGGTPNVETNWSALEQLPGCCGIKIFMGSSTGNLLVSEDDAIRNILTNSNRRASVHCEDEERLKERHHLAVEGGHPKYHPIWRDEETAFNATKRLVTIANDTKHPVHVLHVTTKQEMEFLRKNKHICSVEVLPQHLTLDDSEYEKQGSFAQMNPPIRGKDHQEALWRAVNDGTVDVLGSDHAPHTKDEKAKPYPQSPSGMPGVQTLVPIMLNHVNDGKCSLNKFVEITSFNPSRLFKIKKKGQIKTGFDADITIVDMNQEHVFDHSEMANKSGWTPYHGKKVKGFPTHTIIRGNVVMEKGKLRKDKGEGAVMQFDV